MLFLTSTLCYAKNSLSRKPQGRGPPLEYTKKRQTAEQNIWGEGEICREIPLPRFPPNRGEHFPQLLYYGKESERGREAFTAVKV